MSKGVLFYVLTHSSMAGTFFPCGGHHTCQHRCVSCAYYTIARQGSFLRLCFAHNCRDMVMITVRSDLTRIQRTNLETCITVHMHQKESTEDLVRRKVGRGWMLHVKGGFVHAPSPSRARPIASASRP